MTDPDVAVVVVNFRTARLTLEAVASVLDQPEVREVVVVDNDSGDGSVEVLGERLDGTRARLVESPVNLGFGKGVNLGASCSTSPLLLFLNSDARLGLGSLAPLRAALLSDQKVGVVAPALYLDDGQDLQPGAHGVFPNLRASLARTNRRPPETIWPDWVTGAVMLLRRSDFEALGGFDPDLTMYLEDVDLCWRLRQVGKRARRELSASVYHRLGQSCSSTSDQLDWAHTSRVVYAQKAGLPLADQLYFRGTRALREGMRRMWHRSGPASDEPE